MSTAASIDWTLLFVEDHPIYRDGLKRALQNAIPSLDIIVAESATAAFASLAKQPEVDLVLADQRLGDSDGLSLIGAIRQGYPAIAVGLLCADAHAGLGRRAREMGAVACLSKDRDADSLAEAIDMLFRGGTIFDGEIMADSLSLRRREILALAAEGLLDKQIGDRLGISESTVRNHWQHLFQRLGAANRTEAVTRAIRQGLI